MNKNYYARICRRSDGSIYLEKNHFWMNFFGGAAIILLISAIFTAMVIFAPNDPPSEAARTGEVSYSAQP